MFKRLFDIALALILIILFLPVYLIISLWIFVTMGRPVLFKQKRPGKDGKIFEIIKFRTMADQRDERGELLPDAERLTQAGRIIRSLSLDELPQLVNVLKGDMSFVGPRPLLAEYLPLYDERQKKRHDVKPGITGWAQVNGRNTISWEERFEYDIWYVEHQSFRLDMKILWLTCIKVFQRSGINAGKEVTMEKFKGSKR